VFVSRAPTVAALLEIESRNSSRNSISAHLFNNIIPKNALEFNNGFDEFHNETFTVKENTD